MSWFGADIPYCFTPASTLVEKLLVAKRDLRLTKELKRLDRFVCLILDDIGYVLQDREEMGVLFTLLSERFKVLPSSFDRPSGQQN